MIEVKNVTKKYGNFVAVDNISFTVNDGEVVGFLGPNGAGKSTTMNMITGFIEPTDGTIIVNGFDASKQPIKAKQQIGYMPEGVPLYTDLTVKEFVTYMAELKRVPHKEKKERVTNVLRETGIEDVANRLIKNLSRGYKQRVSLAGALVGDPKIVILDEPTVGLDPKQITEIRELIKELGKTHTIIFSSHILSEVSQICNKVIIINKGKIVAIDTPENLEKKVNNNNTVYVTVEDLEQKMDSIKDKIEEINKDILLEGFFFNEKQELHIFKNEDFYDEDDYEDDAKILCIPIDSGAVYVEDTSEFGAYVEGTGYYLPGDTVTLKAAVMDKKINISQFIVNGKSVKKGKTGYVYTARAYDLPAKITASVKAEHTDIYIKPGKTSVKKAVRTKNNKSIKLTLKKVGAASGYQIKYSTSKKFEKKVTKTVNTKKNMAVIKKLSAKKTYYIKARAYRKTGKSKKYGSWSKVKTVKVKKK